MFVATLHLDLPFVCVGVQEVHWGVLLRTTLRRHQGNRTRQWKKLNCNICSAVTTKLSADLTRNPGTRMALQSCPELKQGGHRLWVVFGGFFKNNQTNTTDAFFYF